MSDLTPVSGIVVDFQGQEGKQYPKCVVCRDVGLVRVERENRWYSAPCACQEAQRVAYRVRNSRIPAGYAQATLENFKPTEGTQNAWYAARRFVENFAPVRNLGFDADVSKAPLFQGAIGTGKTHLAVGIAKGIAMKGYEVRFVDLHDLMLRLKATWDEGAVETEFSVLQSIWKADLVILDDLGRHRDTDWQEQVMETLVNRLYNDPRALLVTTNFLNRPSGAFISREREVSRQRTLGDQIGDRLWSRIQQLCEPKIVLEGKDWRLRSFPSGS